MELVEGEDLSQRIARGAIPLDEALPIAKQIAEALEAAHEQGIIHRDLKPANIKVRPDGTVKVLDFGLAKAVEPVGSSPNVSQSPTITTPAMMTGVGMILGTAAYMSPEQARGKTVDKRADIWAFGCVLFEMVCGKPAFDGEDVAETIGAVIHKEPAWIQLPARTPATVRAVLQRCLHKDPKMRLRDISSVGLLLEDLPADVGRRRRLPWFVAGAAGVVAAVALLAPQSTPRPVERPLVRLDVDLGSDVSLASRQGTDVIVSPDGSRLVFVSQGRLFTRRLDQPRAVELPGTPGAYAPFFSPDGQWVAFFATGQLKKISVEGGAAVTLCNAQGFRGAGGGTWSEDGTIVASLNGITLSRIPDAGGSPAKLTELAEGEADHRWPQVLPGGDAVLLSVRHASELREEGSIDVLSIRDGRRKTLQRGGMFGRFMATSKRKRVLGVCQAGHRVRRAS